MPNSSDLTVALVHAGLDRDLARQQAIAHNIANANTPGFRPARLDFSAQLAQMRQALDAGEPLPDAADLAPPQVNAGDGAVALDEEVAEMSRNNLHYQTLAKLMRREFDLLSLAVSEGRK